MYKIDTAEMNLFQSIRNQYNQNGLRTVRRLEEVCGKLARFRSHLKFNLRCKDEAITPVSLKIKTNVKGNKAEKIINKFRKTADERKN